MSSELFPPVAHVARAMSGFPGRWAIGGGWAVDCWLGRETRRHADVDVITFDSDQRALFEHLRGWHMVPHDRLTPVSQAPWDGRMLELPAHIHSRPPGEENRELLLGWVTPPHAQAGDGLDIEWVIDEAGGDAWLIGREPRVALPFDRAFREHGGVPLVAPEVLTLYKAAAYWGPAPLVERIETHPRPHDLEDFRALMPLLTAEAAAWLRATLELLHSGHPWLLLLE